MKTAINTTLLKIAIGLGVSSALLAQVPTYTASTLMGNYSLTDTSNNSPVTSPYAVTVDANGNVYFTDTIGNRVRRVDATTGAVTTVAGSGGLGGGGTATVGAGTASNPTEPATILGGGVATKVALWQPTGLVFDAAGNLYISDGFNQTVDKVDTNGVLTIFAGTLADSGLNGDGFPANTGRLRNPQRLATDAAGNIYIADKENNRIRKVTTDGIIHTVAGVGGNETTTGHAVSGDGGPAVQAGFGQPEAVAVDSWGNIYLTDNTNNRVRMVQVTNQLGIPLTNSSGQPLTDSTRTIATVVGGLSTSAAGTTTAKGIEGAGTANQTNANPLNNILSSPAGLAIDSNNNVYIADRGNNRILYLNNNYSSCSGSPAICSATPTLTLVAASVTSGGLCVQLCSPSGIYLSGTKLYIAETGINRISVYDVVANTYSVVVQNQTFPFNAPRGVAVNPTTGAVYVADTANQRIGLVPAAGGSMTVIAGISGNAGFPTAGGDENLFNPVKAASSLLNTPWGGAFDLNGNYYFADKGNNRVRMITPAGVITTVAGGLAPPVPSIVQSKGVATASTASGYGGDGLPAVEGQLKSPSSVAVDNVGGTNACPTAPCIYIADTGNNTIRQVSAGGVMTTFAGMAPQCAAALVNGTGVCAGLGGGGYGDGQPAVQPFDPSEVTTATTYGPGGSVTTTTTIGDISSLNTPEGVAVDSSGNVYIADTLNHSIRVVNSTTLVITTLIGDEFAESGHAADGLIGAETFNDSPVAVAVGPDGSVYYAEGCVNQNTFGQCENSRIRRWDVKTGLVTTISAGVNAASLETASYADGTKSTSALALVPTAVAVGPDGSVFFTDATNRVRKFTPSH